MSETVQAVIGLGANVGRAASTIRDAIVALDTAPLRVVAVSRLYRTTPVGVTDQADFHNAVALLDAPAGPDPATGAMALLVRLKDLERAFGRQRRRRWGPREIDLDLEAFGEHAIAVERPPEGQSLDFAIKGTRLLVVPHPESQHRLFVLAPWSDVDPTFRPPGWPATVAEARDRMLAAEGPDAVRVVATWDSDRFAWRRIRRVVPAGLSSAPATRRAP
jgi:2-amino-4-hydroxy-6-hydroxymethyldihydropteridine diphosphokinase